MNGIAQRTVTLKDLSVEGFDFIQKAIILDDLKSEYVTARKEAFFNVEDQINSWLNNISSKNTVRMYKNCILYFLEFVNNDVLNVGPELADKYINSLKKEKVAGKTVQMYFRSVSSFYSHLQRYGHIGSNPFKYSKVKINTVPVKDKVVPSFEDLTNLKKLSAESLSRKASEKMEVALYLMENYGIRKGFLDNMRFSGNTISSFNKGKEYKIILKNEDIKYFEDKKDVLLSLNSNTVSTHFTNLVKKLVNSGKIENAFSPHCIRHYFAVKYYEESGYDIARLCMKLNHASIEMTILYLKSLNMYKENNDGKNC